jgi:hypothetical protein
MRVATEVSIGEVYFPTALNLTPTCADRESSQAADRQVTTDQRVTDVQEGTDKQAKPGVCVYCASLLVQPTQWSQDDDETWCVTMRCPDCYRAFEQRLTQEQVNEFTLEIEGGFRCLLEALEKLDQEAFEAECSAIISALKNDNLYPMDF